MEAPPVLIYRTGHILYQLGFKRIAFLISWINRFLFSTWIPSSASIGKNLTIGYWGLGVVIHSNARIGNHVWISQNATIGRKEGQCKVPVIEDGVFIGPGSVLIGEIVVGTQSVIGANSFVNKNVAPRTVVAGNPARLIRRMESGEIYDGTENQAQPMDKQ